MKLYNLTKKIAAGVAVAAILFTSCEKRVDVDPIGDRGQTLVKLLGGGSDTPLVKYAIDFVPIAKTLNVLDLRRDVANQDDLNKTMTVVIKDDTAAVHQKDPSYVILPTSLYTLQTSDNVQRIGGPGGTFTFVFKPGEFAKQINIIVNDPTQLDPSTTYAVGFSIVSVDAGGVISKAKSVVVTIGAKNEWDGVYAVTGPMTDVVAPNLVQWNNPALAGDPFPAAHGGAWELHLITIGATQCVMFDNTIWGDYFHPILNGVANSGYGSFALIVDFNPANNTVASVVNYYGQPAGNGRSAKLDPSGVNAVQGNKDILIKYLMLQPGTTVRTTFDEKWAYVGSR
ncbi:MAG: hypothetical protein ABIU55_11385 [Ferruginibacter sp.]